MVNTKSHGFGTLFQPVGRVASAILALFFIIGASHSFAGTLDNVARATATAPGGATGGVISNNSQVQLTVVPKDPKYTVVKTVVSMTTSAGASAAQTDALDTITYQYVVDNTGNVSLDTVALVDTGVSFNGGADQPLTTGPTLVSGDTGNDGVLGINETWIYTATYVLNQANVDAAAGVANGVENTVSATAQDIQNVVITPATGSTLTALTTIPSVPGLTILKSATIGGSAITAPIQVGDIIQYSYLVTNTGNVTLNGVGVTETSFNGLGTAPSPTGGATTLAPGAVTTFTATYTVTQADIDNLQ